MFSIEGKRMFVSGGTAGIGLAVATSFADAGARVLVGGRKPRDGLGALAAAFVRCDQSVEADVLAALQHTVADGQPIDVLLVNAGVSDAGGPLSSMDCAAMQDMWQINTGGVAHFLKHAGSFMADGGSVIVTSTPAAELVFPGYAAYAASKAAIGILVRHAAMELGPRGIRVNAISPGSILTDMQPADDAEARICKLATCLQRLGTPQDLLGAFHFLASDASRYVTATELRVDGGWLGGLNASAAERLTGVES